MRGQFDDCGAGGRHFDLFGRVDSRAECYALRAFEGWRFEAHDVDGCEGFIASEICGDGLCVFVDDGDVSGVELRYCVGGYIQVGCGCDGELLAAEGMREG